MQQTSTITWHKSKGMTYFRTSVPHDIAVNLLGLNTDVKKQKLAWRIEQGRVIVEKVHA